MSTKVVQDEHEAWLNDRLGKVSQAIRRIVRSAVIDNGWSLPEADQWHIVLRTFTETEPQWNGDEWELTIWHSGGRFTSSRLRRVTTAAEARTIAETESWVSVSLPEDRKDTK